MILKPQFEKRVAVFAFLWYNRVVSLINFGFSEIL